MASSSIPSHPENKSGKDKMDKAIDTFKRELGTLRTGRASISLLDNVRVDYYGSHLPLNQVATLSVPEPKLITIQAWDKNAVPHIEKAIMNSQLGIVPTVDGQNIRLPIPPLTQERRQAIAKVAREHAEQGRVAVRAARRDSKETLEKLKKDGKIPEDDLRRYLAELQKLTDESIAKVDELLKAKEKEILET